MQALLTFSSLFKNLVNLLTKKRISHSFLFPVQFCSFNCEKCQEKPINWIPWVLYSWEHEEINLQQLKFTFRRNFSIFFSSLGQMAKTNLHTLKITFCWIKGIHTFGYRTCLLYKFNMTHGFFWVKDWCF